MEANLEASKWIKKKPTPKNLNLSMTIFSVACDKQNELSDETAI